MIDTDEVEYMGGPWDGYRVPMSSLMRTPVRHMPGRTDSQPAELVTYQLAGNRYVYCPRWGATREDTP